MSERVCMRSFEGSDGCGLSNMAKNLSLGSLRQNDTQYMHQYAYILQLFTLIRAGCIQVLVFGLLFWYPTVLLIIACYNVGWANVLTYLYGLKYELHLGLGQT